VSSCISLSFFRKEIEITSSFSSLVPPIRKHLIVYLWANRNLFITQLKHAYRQAYIMAVIKRYPKGKQRLFTNDLKSLLYAFGDSATPNIETIHTLEDVVTSYLLDIITEANKIRVLQGRNKFVENDLRFALRNDPVKLGRVEDLSNLSKEISRANKMFDVNEKSLTGKVAKSSGVDNGNGVKKLKKKSKKVTKKN
jgi:transcription initiation factor TFIID subunit 13